MLDYFLQPRFVDCSDLDDAWLDSVIPPAPSNHHTNIQVEPLQLGFSFDPLTGLSTKPRLEVQPIIVASAALEETDKQASSIRTSFAREVVGLPKDYDAVVPTLAKEYPFELDTFQKQAVYHLELGHSIFVAAHTSAGKTAVAEYAIALAGQHLTRAVYTSPIKALSNQKFRDLRDVFGEDSVGLLTGDTQIIPKDTSHWHVTVMTTEILRSMLYRGSDAVKDIEFVIFDEVHYINDAERGVVWEEVIIMLPPAVKVILLSATIPNALEFADWVGRARRSPIHVISTSKRPVPLQHHIFVPPNKLEVAVDKEGKFLLDLKQSAQKHMTTFNWPDLIYFLKKKALLPCVIFTFSRRRCDQQAESLSGIDLLMGAHEQSQIHIQCELAFGKLTASDRQLPQLQWIRELVMRGIGVHHSGLLPIVKELVEILFSRALIRVLFATETFAMGVNMPARTVVFASVRKHDGSTFRSLTPGEYTQMAGRAGRRGQDDVGTVIVLSTTNEDASPLLLKELILGKGNRLTSQFRLTYPMILNLLKTQHLRVEDLIQRSFGENSAQKNRPEVEESLRKLQIDHSKLQPVQCVVCAQTVLSDLFTQQQTLARLSSLIFPRLFKTRFFERGQCVIIGQSSIAVILKVDKDSLQVFKTVDHGCCLSVHELASHRLDSFERATVPPEQVTHVLKGRIAMDPLREDIASLKQHLKAAAIEPMSIPLDKRDLDCNQFMMQRQQMQDLIEAVDMGLCPDMLEHRKQHQQLSTLSERLADLQLSMEEASLALMPEYHARVNVLKHLGYLSSTDGNVTLKGRVAAELATVDALIVSELLFGNFFANLTSSQSIALLSSMVFQDRSTQENSQNEGPSFKHDWSTYIEQMQKVATELEAVQRTFGVCDLSEATQERLNFHLADIVHDWAEGRSFSSLLRDYPEAEVPEGAIVRCIVRLDESCRELRSVSRLHMGDTSLADKMDRAASAIKRDICFASSLYVT